MTGSFYSSIKYTEGKTSLHGPFHNTTEEGTVELTKGEADKARVIAKILVRPVRSKAVLAAAESAPAAPVSPPVIPAMDTVKVKKAKAPKMRLTSAAKMRSAGRSAHAQH